MLHAILCDHPQGLSEYHFLTLLGKHEPIFQTDRSDPMSLFRQHFILFHALYRLEMELSAKRQAHLQITPLQIALKPYQAATHAELDFPDPLRNYYLDLDHLYKTGREEVEKLLNAFWLGITQQDQRAEALQVLGLTDPVDNASIRRRYRELVMRHHPDRGGETARLQLINAAVAALLPDRNTTGGKLT